ncbi:MAG TPA: hypothetical protein VGQ93_01370 [Lysobacter sp.]|nr:hypothetical protein [Lysobacter sp.]
MYGSNHATPMPFWHRLRAIVLYPMRGAALVTLITLTLASLFGMLPVIGWIISILTWLAAYKYAFEILRTTADGRTDSPETVLGVDDGVVWRFFALIFLLILAVAIVAGIFGPMIGLAALAFVVFLQPGFIISLAMDGSLTRALNPAVALSVVGRVGWPYLAVFALLFVIQASKVTASRWLADVMPPVVGDLTLTVVSFWGLFATFHLMGYLVYQYHDALGYEPAAHKDGLPSRHIPDRDLLDRTEALVRDGQTEQALASLREEVRSRAVSLETHELYHRLLRQHGTPAEVSEHAAQYLNLLMLEKQDRRAFNLVREVIEIDPNFMPMSAEDAERLAERARATGQSQLAVDLLRALLRKYPKRAAAARWGLDAALLLVDRYGRDDEARELLETALVRCEDDDLKQKIEAALKPLRSSATA